MTDTISMIELTEEQAKELFRTMGEKYG